MRPRGLSVRAGGRATRVIHRPKTDGKFQSNSWVKQARLAFPAKVVSNASLLAMPILAGIGASLFQGPLARVGGTGIIGLSGVAACAAAALGCWLVARRLSPQPLSFRAWLRGTATLWLVFLPNLLVLLALALALPDRFDQRAVATMAVGAIALVFMSSHGWVWLARTSGLAQPASPRLEAVIATASARVGWGPKAAYVVATPVANAAAKPLSKMVLFTEGALAALDDSELASVCVHELSHLREPRGVLSARLAGMYAFSALALWRPINGSFGPMAFLLVLLFVLVSVRALARLSRRMEKRADVVAYAHEGGPGTYARALEKIHRANLLPVVMSGDSRVHPHLYDRMLAAGLTPEYDRPTPPSRRRMTAALVASQVICAFPLIALRYWIDSKRPTAAGNKTVLLALASATGGSAWDLAQLGRLSGLGGDHEREVALLRAAAASAPESSFYPASLARMLADMHRCEEARQACHEAIRRHFESKSRLDEFEPIADALKAINSCECLSRDGPALRPQPRPADRPPPARAL